MKKSEAKPGTKVLASTGYDEFGDGEHLAPYHYDEDDCDTLVGVVRSKEASPGSVWVKWIEGDFEEDEEEVSLKMLTPESARSEIEKEFKAATIQIKEKMQEAGKLVREAHKMALKAHAISLRDMRDAVDPLVHAMDSAGWRSSSWGC